MKFLYRYTWIRARLSEKLFLYIGLVLSIPLTLTIYWLWSVAALSFVGLQGLLLDPVIAHLLKPISLVTITAKKSMMIYLTVFTYLAVTVFLSLGFNNLMIRHCRVNRSNTHRATWRFLLRTPPFAPLSGYIYFFARYRTDERWRLRLKSIEK
ncbi:MAG: hypothetical protein K0U66_03405 [Gammaproteobacteria bacterium]|nr:hypothetical protein [Pseudomonadota bacterium]MCH9662690.1 hypothetical protein [Gammaproteobacteria bacterium]